MRNPNSDVESDVPSKKSSIPITVRQLEAIIRISESMAKIEKQIKRRFPVGTQVAERNIINDLQNQGFNEKAIYKVLHCFIRRGDVNYRANKKLLYRLK
jgi:hypothetical protein